MAFLVDHVQAVAVLGRNPEAPYVVRQRYMLGMTYGSHSEIDVHDQHVMLSSEVVWPNDGPAMAIS